MLPLHDSGPVRSFPIVTRMLLAANAVLWIYVLYLSRTPTAAETFYARYAFDLPSLGAALSHGTLDVRTFVPLFAHMFIHGGWLHVLGNMLYLWIFGDNVEDAIGSLRFLGLYLVCGAVSAIGQGLLAPGPLVGASGAISGVLGAYLLMFPTARIATLVFLGIFISVIQLPAIIVIGMFILLQIIEGLAALRLAAHPAAQQVAYFAHVFGFLAGVLLLPLLRRSALRRMRPSWS